MARLFVSHSSHSERARRRLAEFVAALGAGRDAVDVLHDRDKITCGDDWRSRINAMLAHCDAAVILLTPDALDSWWVLKEATILTWRRERNPRFPVVPVLLDDVTDDKLRTLAPWAPLDLTRYQLLAADDIAGCAAAVKRHLGTLGVELAPSPFDVLVADIAQLLVKAPLTRCRLLWEDLDGNRLPLDLDDHHRALAEAIGRWMLRQPPPMLSRIAGTLTKLGQAFPTEDIRRIIELVAPLWVDLDAASAFLADTDLAMHCQRPIPVLQHYMSAAHLPDRPPRVFVLNAITAGDSVEDIAAELRTVFRERLHSPGSPPLSDAEVDRRLSRPGARVHVALPMPDDEVVAELRRRFRRVSFIYFVPHGDAVRDVGARWVRPELAKTIEHQVCEDFDAAWETLNTANGFW